MTSGKTRFLIDELLSDALIDRQSRRELMSRVLAVGGAAGLAYAWPRALLAQEASPAASPAASPVTAGLVGVHMDPYDGDLADEQVMRVAMAEPPTMDPGVSVGFDELSIFYNIWDGLTGIDMKTGEVVPRCADSWEMNADATEYVFNVRQDLKWSNGEPLTARDFEYTWKRVLDPDTISHYVTAMYPIKNAMAITDEDDPMDFNELGVTATDDFTLAVQMEAPCPFFPLLTSTWTYFPVNKAVVDKHGDAWVEAENIVSNGPYKLTEWEHDQVMVLEPNEHYFGEAPTITRGEYVIFEDEGTQAFTAFENDEIDFCWPAGSELERAMANPAFSDQIWSFEQSNCRFMNCDCKTAPTDNADFRRALYAAVDRDTLVDVLLKGQASVTYNMLPLSVPGNNPNASNPVGKDAALAALDESGVNAKSLELEYSYRTTPSEYVLVAEYIQQQLQDVLGIKVKLNPIDTASWSDWASTRETEPFHVKWGTWGSDFADPSNWHNQNFTSMADNYATNWKNDEYDRLCIDAVSNTDVDERNQEYRDAEALLVHDAAYIPLYRGRADVIAKPWVKDLHMQPILAVVHLREVKIAPR